MKVLIAALLTSAFAGCSGNNQQNSAQTSTAAVVTSNAPGAADAKARLAASPRHGEWVMVKTGPSDSVRAWLVYPERKTRAPVVVVIHEIFGVSNWIRSVTDQLAADGFIAIAPDLLTSKNIPNTLEGEPNGDSVRAHIGELRPAVYQPQIRKVAEFAMALPAATKKYAVIGFCWGGGAAFAHAVYFPDVNTVAPFYGTSPSPEDLTKVKAPVIGFYGGNDARVNATIPRADSASKAVGFRYEPHVFEGAGHGFLRGQDGQNGANKKAADQAWPLLLTWLRQLMR